jgi:hypothetical protein
MKIEIQLNGTKQEKEIPTKWEEVSFQKFLKLTTCGDDTVKIISLFTDIDEETLKKAKISNLESLITLLGFLKTEMNLNIPDTCQGYKIPKNLEFETIGQYQDLKAEALILSQTNSFDQYALFCAIYATNPYDYKKAEELKSVFMDAPCTEVMAIGNFTLAKLAELTTGIKAKSLLPNIHRKKFWQGLTDWLRSLVFIARYYIWRRKLHLPESNS